MMMHLQLQFKLHPPLPCPSSSRMFLPRATARSFFPQHHLAFTPPTLVQPLLPPSLPFSSHAPLPRFTCKSSDTDIPRQLELGKPEGRRKPDKQVNGIFWVILINLGLFLADHFFQVRGIKSLYLYHNYPAWYQFVTATFCHASWEHLSSNLFFLYIFGKLVEEEEGTFALWFSYILTGVGANLVSWLVLPRNSVSVGASGAVFGLFAISVLVKLTWDWRKILEVLILGQFVVEKVMEAAQSSAAMSGGAGQGVNHIAHLSGALIGVILVWLVSKIPAPPIDD
ncbi:Rhomboid-like protein 11, chloroplastic [Linum perenne]